VSLWQVPQRGIVLVLESLRGDLTAEQVDQLAACLRDGSEEELLRDVAGRLLGDRRAPVTLHALLGHVPDGLPADRPVEDLVIHRPYVTRGLRHVEGLVVALAAGAGGTVDELVTRTLEDADFDLVDRVQEEGHFWTWTRRELVAEPVQKDAGIAVRQDGRAAFVDLEAMSVYHDYLGVGGSRIVLDCLPMVAQRAVEAADFWTTSQLIATLSSGDDVAERVRVVRGVRARLEQRAVLRDMLDATERFTTWTHGGQLWSALHTVSQEQDDVAARSPDERSHRSIPVADRMLNDLSVEQQAERAEFWQHLGTAGTAVGGVISVVVLFTALAAIPQAADRAIQPLLRAGYIATALGVGLTSLAFLSVCWIRGARLPEGRRTANVLGAVLIAAAVVLSFLGSVVPQTMHLPPLIAAAGLALAGGAAMALSGLHRRARR
jgi:hypothetical protein